MSPLATRPGKDARRQSGFSLVAAIFLIVVLAALGAFAVQVAMTQYQGANAELLEAGAQAAAEAGIGYGATVARTTSVCPMSNPTVLTLQMFAVTVTCTQTVHQIYSGSPPAATPYQVYALVATATYGTYGEPDYVARTITQNVTNAPP